MVLRITVILRIVSNAPARTLATARATHGRPSPLRKHPREDRVDVFGVVAEIEFLFDLFLGQSGGDVGVGEEFCLEVGAVFPDFERVALDVGIGVFAADTGLGEGEQDAL